MIRRESRMRPSRRRDSKYSKLFFKIVIPVLILVTGLYLIYKGVSTRETFADGFNVGIGLLMIKIALDSLANAK